MSQAIGWLQLTSCVFYIGIGIWLICTIWRMRKEEKRWKALREEAERLQAEAREMKDNHDAAVANVMRIASQYPGDHPMH